MGTANRLSATNHQMNWAFDKVQSCQDLSVCLGSAGWKTVYSILKWFFPFYFVNSMAGDGRVLVCNDSFFNACYQGFLGLETFCTKVKIALTINTQ